MNHTSPTSPSDNGDFVPEGELSGSDENISIRPEDTIPDLPENQAAREFLRTAPQKGLFMPLGKEVKVMQCWRCKAFGHRTGDKECPLKDTGNIKIEPERRIREDPMSRFSETAEKRRLEKYKRVELMKQLLEEIRAEESEKKERKRQKKEARKAKHKHKHSK